MKINDWPLAERPRERLASQGVKNLSNTELLAILLGFGCRGKTALDLGRELLFSLGGLAKLAESSPEQLCQAKGLGKSKAATLLAALELGKRCLEERAVLGQKLGSSQAASQLLSLKLRGRPQEIFACLFLNNQNDTLAFEELFQGTLREAAVYPREVVKRALFHNAAKVILAHNHPSGHAKPSPEDRHSTEQLKQALALVDIQVVDHIIIGQEEHFSFAEAGLV